MVQDYYRQQMKEGKVSTAKLLPKPPLFGFSQKDVEQQYPSNLSIVDMYYFIVAPTLCYELNFPRTPHIRVGFLLKRICEVVVLSQVMLALVQQWIYPTVVNALQPFNQMDITRMAERIMKLAIPNLCIWLIFFYWFFHSVLNLTAELLRFADRTFYRDWWNCTSVVNFWRNWNISVHRWAVRHLYKPMMVCGYESWQASLAVFLVSAFFHEYMVSIPLCMFRLWAFLAMVVQAPFALVVTKYCSGTVGNIAVWISLIVGQPVAIMMYFHDYYVLHFASKEVNGTIPSAR